MIICTQYGDAEIDEDKIIVMEGPIFGFETVKEYALFPLGDASSIYWLQAVHDAALAFLVADPQMILPDYAPDLREPRHALAIDTDRELVVLGIVTLRTKPFAASINLRAPIVINARTRKGCQVILEDDGFSLRHPLKVDFPRRTETPSTTSGVHSLVGGALRHCG